MLDEDRPQALIMEDDAVPKESLLQVLSNRWRLEKDWELLLLYSGPARHSIWRQRKIFESHRSVCYVTGVAGAVAYLLKQSAARKMLDHSDPVFVPVDYLTGGFVHTGVRCYGVIPNCVSHAPGPSTRSPQPAGLPGDFTEARQAFEKENRQWPAWSARWKGLYASLNPFRARGD
jgi:GR25 family glycosyltransferase involved in LPS biosynthesis